MFSTLAFAAAGCSTSPVRGDLDNEGYRNFQTAVAADRTYDVYWLGRSFEAGGIEYEGPNVPRIGGSVDGGGVVIDYLSKLTDLSSLELTIYSRAAWDLAEKRRGPIPDRFSVKSVDVGGHPAELRTGKGDLTPVSAQILVIDYGDTIVEAETGAVIPLTPMGPQPNPLVDEAAFLAVMEQLRPYPD
jgi:hypothetical protein